tara:strand:+ start:5134 stop:5622 length:489 start_codon:yes stop_codon:yes gene_type:complete
MRIIIQGIGLMSGTLGKEQLEAALGLSESIKSMLRDFETKNWAANLSAPEVKKQWGMFISALESAVKTDRVNDELLINLIRFLSTLDSAALLEQIGQLDDGRQVRFMELMNWVAQESPDEGQRKNASQVRERILMTYRLNRYPDVYSTSRLARAYHVISSSM